MIYVNIRYWWFQESTTRKRLCAFPTKVSVSRSLNTLFSVTKVKKDSDYSLKLALVELTNKEQAVCIYAYIWREKPGPCVTFLLLKWLLNRISQVIAIKQMTITYLYDNYLIISLNHIIHLCFISIVTITPATRLFEPKGKDAIAGFWLPSFNDWMTFRTSIVGQLGYMNARLSHREASADPLLPYTSVKMTSRPSTYVYKAVHPPSLDIIRHPQFTNINDQVDSMLNAMTNEYQSIIPLPWPRPRFSGTLHT